MIRPDFRCFIDGRTALTSRTGLFTKNSSWSRHARQVRSSIFTNGCGPVALRTSMSMGPKRRCDLGDHPADLFLVADVGGERLGLPARLADPADDLAGLVGAAEVVDGHLRAARPEPLGDGRPEAARCAGHEGHSVPEILVRHGMNSVSPPRTRDFIGGRARRLRLESADFTTETRRHGGQLDSGASLQVRKLKWLWGCLGERRSGVIRGVLKHALQNLVQKSHEGPDKELYIKPCSPIKRTTRVELASVPPCLRVSVVKSASSRSEQEGESASDAE